MSQLRSSSFLPPGGGGFGRVQCAFCSLLSIGCLFYHARSLRGMTTSHGHPKDNYQGLPPIRPTPQAIRKSALTNPSQDLLSAFWPTWSWNSTKPVSADSLLLKTCNHVIYIYIYIYMCRCIHICIYVCMCVYICIGMYMYMYTYIYIYIYVDIYTHINLYYISIVVAITTRIIF